MGVQAGDKFIIQIGGILTDYTPEHKQVYRVKGFNSLVFDEEGIKRLTPLDDALTSYQKVGRALCEWADDAFLTDYEEACDWLSAHMKDTPLQVLPPEKGMIEKYIDLAVKLKRDINITMDQDGRYLRDVQMVRGRGREALPVLYAQPYFILRTGGEV